MKKYIPLSILTLSLVGLQSCREHDFFETEYNASTSLSSRATNVKDVKVIISNNDIKAVSKDNDPDPPVKDGQDWKNASN